MRNYLTVKMSPIIKQMTLEELLFAHSVSAIYINKNETNTRTFEFDKIPEKYLVGFNITQMIDTLRIFNQKYACLRNGDRHELYHTFYLPKKSGGLRRIDAPDDDLKRALKELKEIFEDQFHVLYHTSAFAYIKGRSTLAALKRHQGNRSRWYGKLDLSNFFGSTTLDFTMSMLERIFPFSEIMSWDEGRIELRNAIELGFLDGGLPQGTPLSPTLTNIIMIPIDYEFNKMMRAEENKYVCTRYADDFIISSRYDFSIRDIEATLRDTLKMFDAPYIIKPEKTRYGSVAGQNWNLGLMVNSNNEITVGHKRKREFKAMLTNYIMDFKHGKIWDVSDVQVMEGLRNYYSSVEPNTIQEIITRLNCKFGVDIKAMIDCQLRG